MLIYIDEDPWEALGPELRRLGCDAIAAREAGNKGLSDPLQLAFATDHGRAIVTCNRKDFELLHETLLMWSRRWGITGASHAGIIIIPSGSRIRFEEMLRLVSELAQQESSLHDRLFKWSPRVGWEER